MALITHNISTANDGLGDQLRTILEIKIQWTRKYTPCKRFKDWLNGSGNRQRVVSIVPNFQQLNGNVDHSQQPKGTYTN
jgi:hypothetical protein